MEQALFYHFLKTKEEEEENGYSQNSSEVIEKRLYTPQLLQLFPWEIKKVLKTSDLTPDDGLELSFTEAWDYLIQHLENSVATDMINYRDQVSIKICDMDTNTEHYVSLRKAINSNMFYIQGRWFPEFVSRRNLREGTMIGMYRDNKSSALRFSILDSD